MNQKDRDVPVQPDTYLYVNPVAVEEQPTPSTSTSKADPVNSKTIACSLQNGEPSKKPGLQGKGLAQTSLESPYRRPPPPRPPSLGSGLGLLFSSPQTSAPAPEPERSEEEGEKDEKKPTCPPPSRPPVPLQGRAAPPLPPAPLLRTSSSYSSRKSSVKESTAGGDDGQNPAKRNEKGGERGKPIPVADLLGEEAEQEAGRRDEGDLKTVKEDKLKSQGPPLTKKPSRPIPPPRTKPTNSPACSSQVGGGASTNQSAETKPPPPSPRRPDVSLYSPQGGGALGPDLDSCSTSSTEEEGETNQEQETSRWVWPQVKRAGPLMLIYMFVLDFIVLVVYFIRTN